MTRRTWPWSPAPAGGPAAPAHPGPAHPAAPAGPSAAEPGPPGERDFFERTYVGWHALYAAMLALALLITAASAPAEPGAVAALLGMGAAYLLLGVPAARDDAPDSPRAVAYLAVSYLLLGAATYADPGALTLLFALYPQTFALLRARTAVAAVAVLTAVFTAALIAAEGWSWDVVLGKGVNGLLSLAFSVVVGLYITGLVRQNEERRVLLVALASTRDELGRTQHAAGAAAERERMAREIHDTLAQGFTSVVMLAQAAEGALDHGDADAARRRLAQVQRVARDNLRDARALVAASAPAPLAEGGLGPALARLGARVAEETGVPVDVDVPAAVAARPTAVEVALLRAAQEGLANARRHARARRMRLALAEEDGALVLTVSDDGAGFDPGGVPAPGGGYGLAGLRARVAEAGGQVEVRSAPGAGTTVEVRVP